MVNFISPRTHERLHHTKERWLTVSNAPCPTLELETEPEHRLTTLQYFYENVAAIRNGTNERFKWAVNGRNEGKHPCDDVGQRTVLHGTRLDDANLLLPHAPQNWPRVLAPGRGAQHG